MGSSSWDFFFCAKNILNSKTCIVMNIGEKNMSNQELFISIIAIICGAIIVFYHNLNDALYWIYTIQKQKQWHGYLAKDIHWLSCIDDKDMWIKHDRSDKYLQDMIDHTDNISDLQKMAMKSYVYTTFPPKTYMIFTCTDQVSEHIPAEESKFYSFFKDHKVKTVEFRNDKCKFHFILDLSHYLEKTADPKEIVEETK